MLTVEGWTTIRYLHAQGVGVRAICRELGVARKTVRRALRGDGAPKYERPPRPNAQLEPFAAQIRELYFAKRLIGSRILRGAARALGYAGSPSAFYAHLKTLKVLLPPGGQGDRAVRDAAGAPGPVRLVALPGRVRGGVAAGGGLREDAGLLPAPPLHRQPGRDAGLHLRGGRGGAVALRRGPQGAAGGRPQGVRARRPPGALPLEPAVLGAGRPLPGGAAGLPGAPAADQGEGRAALLLPGAALRQGQRLPRPGPLLGGPGGVRARGPGHAGARHHPRGPRR